jgi:hypothetical protein
MVNLRRTQRGNLVVEISSTKRRGLVGRISIPDPKDNLHDLTMAVVKIVTYVNAKYEDDMDIHALTLEAIHAYRKLGDAVSARVGDDRPPLEVEPIMQGVDPRIRITVFCQKRQGPCLTTTLDPADRKKCVIAAGALAEMVNERFGEQIDTDYIACLMDKWFDTQNGKIIIGGGVG